MDENSECYQMWKAVRESDVERVRELLANGADPNARYSGEAPLDNVYSGEIARLLLEHGADPRARDCLGATPLHIFGYGKSEVARILIEYGADVNARDERGVTPLLWAPGDTAAVLLAAGAEVNYALENDGASNLGPDHW